MFKLDEVQGIFSSLPPAELAIEDVMLADALGRIAAEDVFSSIDIPPSANSAMDGFAINYEDLLHQKNNTLRVSQRVPAGSIPTPLIPGTAARIFTGAYLPEGADTVVIQENCDHVQDVSGSKVVVLSKPIKGANIRPQGQDITVGAKVVRKGQRLNAIDLSLLASVGKASVGVFERLRVAIFSTGNELAEPGHKLNAGQIYNSNRPLLWALCQQLGFVPVDCGIVEDTLPATQYALKTAASKAHLILSSGGVSVGEEDHVKPAIESLGKLEMWKVRIKPGKPVAYGSIDGSAFLGLPGNPVSSFVVFQLLTVPLMRALQGEETKHSQCYSVVAGFDKKITTREEYVRVKIRREGGNLIADRFPNLSSGVLSSLSWADGLVRHKIDCAISYGDPVDFFPFTEAML